MIPRWGVNSETDLGEVSRRRFLKAVGLTTTGLALGSVSTRSSAEGEATAGDRAASPDFMHPIKPGRVFTSLDEARRTSPRPGDVVLLRDLSQLVPADVWCETFVRGKWHLRPYRLADGQSGRLLMVCDFAGNDGPAAVPPKFEVKLDLPGWYAIWLGCPLMDRCVDSPDGIDMALDGEPGYTLVRPEASRFRGRWKHPFNCEYLCYWKCAPLDGQTLHMRMPWGTYSAVNWGLVRGGFSALKLIRLSDQQAQAYLADVADPSTKRVMVLNDGFSPYFDRAEPGNGFDAQLAMAYRNTDVGKYILQTPNTGVASWPSKATSLVGELVATDDWKLMRKGDQRICDYVRWAVRNGKESYRVAADVLKGSSTELHASLRMNLFFPDDGPNGPFGKIANGKFWYEHPEMRKPGSMQLDYALPEVRLYIKSILMELASNYEVCGINMDFTRWPPIADPARHDFHVLLSFIKEVRQSLDRVQAHKGRKLALSAHLADTRYSGGDLMSQKIDLDAWLEAGVLDFISVETTNQQKYLPIAKRRRVPYYAIQDTDTFPDQDPLLGQPGPEDHDPYPGEEFIGAKELDKKFGTGVDPTDYDRGFSVRYAQGVDGVGLQNHFMGERTVGRMGHVKEMSQRAVTGTIWGQEPGPSITV